MKLRQTLGIAIAVLATGNLTFSSRLAAATLPATAPNITYTAAGTFSSAVVSGADTLKLAGQPFTVSVVVSAATVPFKTGPNYAIYNKLKLTGSVYSGLLGSTPINIASAQSTIQQAINPANYDQLVIQAPIQVIGIGLTVKAVVLMPLGTIARPLLYPFKAVALAPGNATVTYSDGSASTVLSIQTGTLTATIPAAAGL